MLAMSTKQEQNKIMCVRYKKTEHNIYFGVSLLQFASINDKVNNEFIIKPHRDMR